MVAGLEKVLATIFHGSLSKFLAFKLSSNGVNASAIFALDTPLQLPGIVYIASYQGRTSKNIRNPSTKGMAIDIQKYPRHHTQIINDIASRPYDGTALEDC